MSKTIPVEQHLISLESQDKVIFRVSAEIANQSQVLADLIGDLGDQHVENPIPLPNVSSKMLEKIIEFCKHYETIAVVTPDLDVFEQSYANVSEWDQQFISIPTLELFDLIQAANYLDIRPLMDLGCKKAADLLVGKKPEEIREMFDIENDLTPEEVQKIMK